MNLNVRRFTQAALTTLTCNEPKRAQVYTGSIDNTHTCNEPKCAQVYTGSIDNSIKVWDLRKEGSLATHKGHTDSVTGERVCVCACFCVCMLSVRAYISVFFARISDALDEEFIIEVLMNGRKCRE
jgi:hypothetical protein